MNILEMVTKLRLTAAEELKRRNAPLPRAQADLIRQQFHNLFTPQMIIDLLDEITCRAELAVLRSEQIGRLREKLEAMQEFGQPDGQAKACQEDRAERQAALDRLFERLVPDKVLDGHPEGSLFDGEVFEALDRLMRRWGTKE